MLIISFLRFIFFTVFFLYLPAKIIFAKLKIKSGDQFIDTGLSITFGITFITLLTLILRLSNLDLLFLWVIPAVSLISVFSNLKLPKSKISQGHILIFLMIFLGVVTQNLVLFRGGNKTSAGYIFPSVHDTMWNIALIQELYHHNPAQNPAMITAPLKNNHYFYPLFLAATRFVMGIDIYDLYFRFMPVLVSMLFGLGIYAVGKIFVKDVFFRALTIFLGYFSGSFAYFVPLFLGKNFDWKGNTFFADQPFDQIINPYSVFGFVLMLFGIYCLAQIINSRGNSKLGYSIVGATMFGILYGFKSFGGLLIIASLIGYSIFSLLIYRKILFLTLTILAIILFSSVFFFITDPTRATLIWAPGWLLTQMVADKDKVYLPYLVDVESYYKLIGNYLGLLKIKMIELIIYLLGNLGTRIIGLLYLLYILFIMHVHNRKYIMQFIGISAFISLMIPLLFNLRNSTFNIIQFTPYGLVLSATVSVYVLEKIYLYFARNQRKIPGVLLIVCFIILSIPVNAKNILSKIGTPEDTIAREEMEALKFLNGETTESDILLIDPKKFSQDPIYIPAISERRVYLASPGYASQTGYDPKTELERITYFFQTADHKFLQSNNINYIYLLKEKYNADELKILENAGFINVFENEKVIILKST